MPNTPKITGAMEILVRSMCDKGYNATHISKQVGLAKGTIRSWATKNGYSLSKRISNKLIDLEPKIVELLKNGLPRKQIQKELKVHYTQVTEIATKYGLINSLRTRAQASLDKILTIEEAQKRIPNENGTVIGFNQKNKKYVIKTEDGFIYYKKSAKLYQGDPRKKSGRRLQLNEVMSELSKLGYEYIDGWTIKRNPIRAKHLKCGNIRENRLRNFYFQDCATCNNSGTSKSEQELLQWIRGYYPSADKLKFNERITKPKEIDVYIPELKLGIEYCGLHWHNENVENSLDNKHYRKMLQANKEGIRLITIFENEWIEKKDQIKGFLKSVLKKNSITIYARDCESREISNGMCDDFMDKYHIQGRSSKSRIAFGLFYNNELIAAINGGSHPQGSIKNKNTLFLNRLAFKSDITVIGGASKLFKLLVFFAKSHNYSNIISWSDNRWSEGNIYKILGFHFSSQKDKGRGLIDGSIWPDFKYAMRGKLFSRQEIKTLNLEFLELPKIYDCGKKRWEYNL